MIHVTNQTTIAIYTDHPGGLDSYPLLVPSCVTCPAFINKYNRYQTKAMLCNPTRILLLNDTKALSHILFCYKWVSFLNKQAHYQVSS